MKKRILRFAALLLLLVTAFAASACRSGQGSASSAPLAPESSEAAEAVNADGLVTAKLDPFVEDYDAAPVYNGPAGVLENLRLLYTYNPDTVGWLTVKNGGDIAFLDYPVVQSYDNNFYLRRSFFGGYAHGGTVFLHYRCDPVDLSKNTVIFGHNLKDQSLFAQLLKYNSPSFYDSASIIEYSTLYKKYQYKIFAAFYTTTRFDYIRASYPDDKLFLAVVNQALARSVIKTNVDVDAGDSIITLSTCAYVDGVDGARFVVMGRLLRAGESAGGCRAAANPDALDIRAEYHG
ncbi:MAG: class B sortase [Clostridia bacterium]|nr:class B sortase [Clostridia bacterium]